MGASDVDEYFEMAVEYADEVLERGKFMYNVSGVTKNVQRYTLGDNFYIDIVKNKKIIISFGEVW